MIERLVESSELKTNRLNEAKTTGKVQRAFSFRYDNVSDAALILLIQPQEGLIVHYLDDHIGFLYEENSLEIVGLRIEAFAQKFVPANENVQRVWLSIANDKVQDFGQVTIMFERIQPQVVQEVVRATQPMLGKQGSTLASLVGV